MSRRFSYFVGMAAKRWLLLLGAVVLLHLLVIDWAFLRFRTPLSRSVATASVPVELLSPPAPPKISPNRQLDTTQAPHPSPEMPPKTPRTKAGSMAEGASLPAPSVTAPALASNPPTAASARGNRDLPSFPADLPPSAELRYNLRLDRRGHSVSGNGRLLWMRSNNQYANIHGDFTVPDAYSLQFLSEGAIHPPHGISPLAYTEKLPDKPEAKARFEREGQIIRFSESQKSHPILGGEQDTASVIWQLSGIGRHDGGTFRPAVQFQLFVAGTHNADIWLISIVGLEEIETPLGKLQAWHLLRAAPAGTQEQTLEFWLAPDREWYPVKLRYTEANGDTLDLTVSEISLVPDT